jgi:hypothetical protein
MIRVKIARDEMSCGSAEETHIGAPGGVFL